MMKKVYIRFEGGLGNQLFQLAFGLHVMNITGRCVFFDTLYLNKSIRDVTKRNFELDVVKENILIKNFSSGFLLICIKIFNKFNLPFFGKRLIYERLLVDKDNFISNKTLKNITHEICFVGYWQNRAYVDNVRDLLLTFIKPEKLNKIYDCFNPVVLGSNSVSVHVRRGDYVTNTAATMKHGVCDMLYYSKAIKYFETNMESPNFYFFSDDIDWVVSSFGEKPNYHYALNEMDTNPWRDILLMSSCSHHIIANSTYSWWGAWLNSSNNKVVVAPQFWAVASGKELIYPDWVLI